MKIILASKSPARKKLLLEMGLKFEIIPADIDEEKFQDTRPSVRVKKIAKAKAEAILKRLIHEGSGENEGDVGIIIIAADTMVYCHGKLIGKPKNLPHAKEILTLLSGSTHYLYTGICLIYKSSNGKYKIFLDFDKTKVFFRKLSEEEISSYVADPEVLNHAGTYTIEKSTPGEGFIKNSCIPLFDIQKFHLMKIKVRFLS